MHRKVDLMSFFAQVKGEKKWYRHENQEFFQNYRT